MKFKTETAVRVKAESAGIKSKSLLPESVFAMMLLSIAAYLGVSSFYLASNLSAFVQHVGIVLLFIAMVAVNRLCQHVRVALVMRCVLLLGFISYLYNEMAFLAFNTVPWTSDGLLFSYETKLGFDVIHLQIAPLITQVRWMTELLSFGYAAFIPYLCTSVFLHGTSRDAQTRELFLLSVTVLYASGFLGYLFVPAYGPIVHLAEQFVSPVNGGFFHTLVSDSVDQAGGPHGAFPSIHIGAAVLMCLFDFRHGSVVRGWLYVPLVVLIAMATITLRYHYVIDLLAGFAIAVFAMFVAERWFVMNKPSASKVELSSSVQPG